MYEICSYILNIILPKYTFYYVNIHPGLLICLENFRWYPFEKEVRLAYFQRNICYGNNTLKFKLNVMFLDAKLHVKYN